MATGGAGRGKRVVVVGLGDTGVLVAANLPKGLDVTAVGTRPALVSGQELGNRVADPEGWRRNYLVPLRRFRRLDRVCVRHGKVAGVDLPAQTVAVETADGGEITVPYDVLVIATGVTNGFWRSDRVEDLASVEAGLGRVAGEIDAASTVAVVGGGATGVSAAYNLARRHPDKDLHLFFSGDEPLPGYHPDTRGRLARQLAKVGVELHPGHRAALPDGFTGAELTSDPIEWSTGQEPFTADVVLWAVGRVRPNTGFPPAELLDEHGFVRVDEHLQAPDHPEVFAVDDVAASDPQRSSARNWGYRVVTHNVGVALGGKGKQKAFVPPRYRWGSITGIQDDGLTVFQPNGKAFRVPRWAVQPLLFDLFTQRLLYRGLRRDT
ncbi:MAG TPA: FAD-dependent oxidoreductase [Acidimicrobiales bacterium]|nr:FAD-dependent oxidoreductase [Acidimicrobiales bacterium]